MSNCARRRRSWGHAAPRRRSWRPTGRRPEQASAPRPTSTRAYWHAVAGRHDLAQRNGGIAQPGSHSRGVGPAKSARDSRNSDAVIGRVGSASMVRPRPRRASRPHLPLTTLMVGRLIPEGRPLREWFRVLDGTRGPDRREDAGRDFALGNVSEPARRQHRLCLAPPAPPSVPPPDAPRGTLQYGEPALTRDAGCRSASLVWSRAQLHYPT
jgi:hypothetical protein